MAADNFGRKPFRGQIRAPRMVEQDQQVPVNSATGEIDPSYDGKRVRKAVNRKTIDYNASVIRHIESRVWQRGPEDRRSLQPDICYYGELLAPASYLDNPVNAATTKFVRTSTNKFRCPIFCVRWTPEGRRLMTGASSGEFTLWNGLTFNFETILQAHDSAVRTMTWSHNDLWLITADHSGYVKYWQTNMNNVHMLQAHKEAVREASFCPTDTKFTTCSDDGTVRIWDFLRSQEEQVLRGHGADVKCVDWHPHKGLIASGSKDTQQPVKLWDPKSGSSLVTLHGHKSTVMTCKWNMNGNWLLTGARDHLLKLFDIRMMKEMQTFRGHKREATTTAWHPIHESLFASGGSDGSILFWVAGGEKEVGGMENAHDGMVWSLAWHPLGHLLCSGSNDHTSKFWARNRPGDKMKDKYNSGSAGGAYDESEDVFISAVPSTATAIAEPSRIAIPGFGELASPQPGSESRRLSRPLLGSADGLDSPEFPPPFFPSSSAEPYPHNMRDPFCLPLPPNETLRRPPLLGLAPPDVEMQLPSHHLPSRPTEMPRPLFGGGPPPQGGPRYEQAPPYMDPPSAALGRDGWRRSPDREQYHPPSGEYQNNRRLEWEQEYDRRGRGQERDRNRYDDRGRLHRDQQERARKRRWEDN
eukprot:m.37002 g.37002  ORF g.37002 m.37002 type:complete len:641 (+) comp32310_c0_seq2:80-2002(+)